ncbi:alpha-xylosidase [Streptomyces cucumeris]|uniref:glycoside hydrolase family 31 protein n=1 Tax=Streptomyces cucumeris TaxID=2962890 RepID=UPI003D73AF63
MASSLHPRDHFPFIAPPPPLTPAYPGATDPLVTGSVTGLQGNGAALAVRTATGRAGELRVRIGDGNRMRVTLRMADTPTAPRTALVHEPDRTGVRCDVTPSEHGLVLRAAALGVRIRYAPFALDLLDDKGEVLLRQAPYATGSSSAPAALPLGVTPLADGRLAHHASWSADPDEHFYGLGERFTGLDLHGQRIDCWIQDAMGCTGTRSYVAIPYLLSSRGYALLLDSTTAAAFDLAHTSTATWSVTVPDEVLDFYLITGDPGRCLAAYRDLTGPALCPPKWAFGPWISGGFQPDSADAVRERARHIRDRGFPCDVLHIDTYWQPHGSWSDMRWDTGSFPDPERLHQDLAQQGFRVSLWMNPYLGTGSPYYAEAERAGWFLRTAAGDTCVSDVWGGEYHPPCALLDLTHPGAAAWLTGRVRETLESGAAVLKTDFGEAIPADAVAHNGMTGDRLHNLYPLLYNDLVTDATRAATGGSGLTWGRSSWTGGQRHGVKWTGDPDSGWPDLAATLRAGLSLSFSGHPFWSHDIGGFHGTPTPELFVRWAQFGLLSPLSRFHGITSRLPWEFGESAYTAVLHAARLRMSLLPYVYAAAADAVRTGAPLARPMPFDHPDRPDAHTADLQYLLGPDLLVAPPYAPGGRRQVWFPPGEWLPYDGGTPRTGPAWHHVELPLSTCPLWLRAGSLLLTTTPADRAGATSFEDITATWVRPLDTAHATFHDTDATHIPLTARLTDGHLTLTTAVPRLRIAVLGHPGPPPTADLNGVAAAVTCTDRLDL